MTPRLTVSIPCFGRPERTKRAINCILDQDINGWEALIVGDECDLFQDLISSGYMEMAREKAMSQGNILDYYQWRPRSGGHGYKITNHNIQVAKGKYLVFYANDDIILPTHFRNYLEIERTSYDYMYFDSYINVLKEPRRSILAKDHIGHSEIIIKTELAKKLPPHTDQYGHDWDFINNMIHNGTGAKSNSKNYTYRVMSIPSLGCSDGID